MSFLTWLIINVNQSVLKDKSFQEAYACAMRGSIGYKEYAGAALLTKFTAINNRFVNLDAKKMNYLTLPPMNVKGGAHQINFTSLKWKFAILNAFQAKTTTKKMTPALRSAHQPKPTTS